MTEQFPAHQNLSPMALSPNVVQSIRDSAPSLITDDDINRLQDAGQQIGQSEISPAQREDAAEILLQGIYKGKEVGLTEALRSGAEIVNERIWAANLVKRNPEVAQTLVEKEIAGFHATSSFALAGLIEEGALLSGRQLYEKGKAAITGAHDAHAAGQNSISFGSLQATKRNVEVYGGGNSKRTDEEVVADLTEEIESAKAMAADYPEGAKGHAMMLGVAHNAELALRDFRNDPNSLAATMMRWQFPVAVGISRSFVREAEQNRASGSLLIGQSYYGEFRPATDVIPIEALPVIAVPEDKIEPVEKLLTMFGYEQVTVVPLEAVAA